MAVRQWWIMHGMLLVFMVNGVFSHKRDVSWFGQQRTSKIQSPNLEHVIDETLESKQRHHHDTIAQEAKDAGLKYHALGCFAETNKTEKALPKLLADLTKSIKWKPNMRNFGKIIQVCAMEAKKEGVKVFGLREFGRCYSGDDALHTYNKYGKSDDCDFTDKVGLFQANFVYMFDLPPVPMKRPTHVYCFPGDSQVQTNNQKLTMSTLRIGDQIKTLDRQGNPVYSEVIAFLHRQESSIAEYLSIITDNGLTLRVSNKHLVFKIEDTTSKTIAVFASDLKVGDTLFTVGKSSETSRIVKIAMATQNGIYAPLTRHGTMIVDGVLVSCYAHWDSHTVAHITMAPLRLWTDLTSLVTSLSRVLGFHGNTYGGNNEGINWYALSLMSIVEKFVPLQ